MSLEKILANSSAPICDEPAAKLPLKGSIYEELNELLTKKNGLYMLEGALLIRPSYVEMSCDLASIQMWNDSALWKNEKEMKCDRIKIK